MKYLLILIVIGIIALMYINRDSFEITNQKYIKSAKTLTYKQDVDYDMMAFPSNTGGGILSGSENPYEKLQKETPKRKYWQ